MGDYEGGLEAVNRDEKARESKKPDAKAEREVMRRGDLSLGIQT